MLPDHRFQGLHSDDKFILEELAKLPHAWRSGACSKYSEVYATEGRRSANTKLRQYVKRVNER